MTVGWTIFFTLLAVGLCQKQFSADFELRHPDMPNGVINGVIEYNWDEGDYRLTFPDQGNYVELYKFNGQRGFGTESDRYESQFVYRSGGACGLCQTATLQHGMPVLFNGNNGNQDGDPVLEISIEQGRVQSATFEDGRQLIFSNLQKNPGFGSNFFDPPDNCACGKPLDMVFVLDRSGSISVGEFKQERLFVQKFSEAFEYGPKAAQLGITHFKRESFDDPRLTLERGNTKSNVETGVASMACDCDGVAINLNTAKDNARCCCCGTAVSSGMRNGADMMASQSIRPNAFKIIMVLTDGRHNRIYDGIDDITGKPVGRRTTCPKNDQGNADCKADLEEGVAYVKSQVPDVQLFAISVGLNEAAEREQLLVIADNNPDRILDAVSFDQLPSIVDQLVALTCDNTAVPCGNCCGFCTCGECVPPSGCDPVNNCKDIALVGSCCTVSDKEPDFCDEDNKCLTYTCDESANDGTGGCVSEEDPIPEDTDCTDYECETETGEVIASDLCPLIPNCVVDLDCDDLNVCTIDECILAIADDPNSAICDYTDSAPCDDGDACTSDSCDTTLGCIFQNRSLTCEDNNVCTTDFCNSTSLNYTDPCVHIEIICNFTNSTNDTCFNTSCHSTNGCEIVRLNCTEGGNCTISGCDVDGCYIDEEDCDDGGFPIAAGIAGGVIAGIVAAAVLAALICGGGTAYAYSQGGGAAVTTPVQANPIYVGSGTSGVNPVYAPV